MCSISPVRLMMVSDPRSILRSTASPVPSALRSRELELLLRVARPGERPADDGELVRREGRVEVGVEHPAALLRCLLLREVLGVLSGGDDEVIGAAGARAEDEQDDEGTV